MGWIHFKPGWRFGCLAAALLLLTMTFIRPTLPLNQDTYRYVFVVDITQSMNARDYHVDGMPADRLGFAKETIRQTLQALPCHSEIGLAVFSTKNIFLFFEPLKLCAHFSVIEESLMHIDWRMAWAADSHIARGLFTSIRDLAGLEGPPDLVFFSDGQQTPADAVQPPFLETPGTVRGFIVGVGGTQPVPVPKLDRDNLFDGFWTVGEAEGRKPRFDPDGSQRPSSESDNDLYLSGLRETELKRLSGITGLTYHRLQSSEKLARILQSSELARTQAVDTDMRWVLAAAALLLIMALYLPDFVSMEGGKS
ncbi:MAG: vWA domain-containing protein [Pseudomonadota bacterium]